MSRSTSASGELVRSFIGQYPRPRHLGDTTFKHIGDLIAFAVRLDDGSEYELTIARENNPVPMPTEW